MILTDGNSRTFFFFQAADGIRARNVTGVQTCALPISSAIGEKPRGGAPAPTTIIATPQGTTTIGAGIAGAAQVQGQVQPPFLPFPSLVSSSIYRISADGAPEELWTSREDVVYELGLASDGRLLAGTGNNGALQI